MRNHRPLPRVVLLAACAGMALSACSDSAAPSALGVWEFNASYGGNGYSCTITGSTLTLGREPARWTGSLSGGELSCVAPPGESSVPPVTINVALDSVNLSDNSIAFKLTGEPFMVSGEVTGDQMSGTLQAATPFCQCTEPFLSGTWTADRVELSAASGRP